MRLALGLAVVGVILGVVAAVGFLNSPSDAGDPDGVEATLSEGALPPPTTTSQPLESTTTTEVDPLWVANEASLLTELTTTASSSPRRLVIESLDIDAPVGAYGVDSNGQMDVPDNITEVGWYKHGPSPGDPGSAVLAAHVDLRGPGRGLFYDLHELEVGATVQVSYEDGNTSEFEVVARSTYLKSELPLEAIFSRQGEPVLTLITCGGGFSRSAGSYDSNVVVYAVPVGQDAGEDAATS